MTTGLSVDKRACIGSGLCAAMHPDLFRVTDDGLGDVVRPELDDADDIESAEDVASCCPGEAVRLVELTG